MAKKNANDKLMVFSGWILHGDDGDGSNILFLVDPNSHQVGKPLAERFSDEVRWNSGQVSVRYHITNDMCTVEDAQEIMLVTLMGGMVQGKTEVDYGHRYSELTGYLWTDEKLKIGGHDLLAELRSHLGKWCNLIVTFHGRKE